MRIRRCCAVSVELQPSDVDGDIIARRIVVAHTIRSLPVPLHGCERNTVGILRLFVVTRVSVHWRRTENRAQQMPSNIPNKDFVNFILHEGIFTTFKMNSNQ